MTPLQGLPLFYGPNPGRCPGLSHGAPLGLGRQGSSRGISPLGLGRRDSSHGVSPLGLGRRGSSRGLSPLGLGRCGSFTASACWGWEGVVRHAASAPLGLGRRDSSHGAPLGLGRRCSSHDVCPVGVGQAWFVTGVSPLGLRCGGRLGVGETSKKPALHRRVRSAFLTAARRAAAVVTYRVEMSSL